MGSFSYVTYIVCRPEAELVLPQAKVELEKYSNSD